MCEITSDPCTRITLLVGDGRVGATKDDQFFLSVEVTDCDLGVDLSERHITKNENWRMGRYWFRTPEEAEELAWALNVMAKKARMLKKDGQVKS